VFSSAEISVQEKERRGRRRERRGRRREKRRSRSLHI